MPQTTPNSSFAFLMYTFLCPQIGLFRLKSERLISSTGTKHCLWNHEREEKHLEALTCQVHNHAVDPRSHRTESLQIKLRCSNHTVYWVSLKHTTKQLSLICYGSMKVGEKENSTSVSPSPSPFAPLSLVSLPNSTSFSLPSSFPVIVR